jgi:hypothetical protein
MDDCNSMQLFESSQTRFEYIGIGKSPPLFFCFSQTFNDDSRPLHVDESSFHIFLLASMTYGIHYMEITTEYMGINSRYIQHPNQMSRVNRYMKFISTGHESL